MTPENLNKWFNVSEYYEIHVHSMLVRNKSLESKGWYGLKDDTIEQIEPKMKIVIELGVSLRKPSDTSMRYVHDCTLTMTEADLEEFKKDFLPTSEMSKVLYQSDD